MTAFLVRHARAGHRGEWRGDDESRPLDESGRVQAKWLAELLGDAPLSAIVSSPSTRCVESVAPLADAVGLEIRTSAGLAEGRRRRDVQHLLDEHAEATAVLCSHGDVIADFLDHLHEANVISSAERDLHEKGSVWALELAEGSVVDARYHSPPT